MTKSSGAQAASSIELVERACAVCGATDSILAYDQPTENIVGIGDIGYHHLIKVCSGCGFVFASPLLPESSILRYYEQMSNYEHPESTGIRPVEDVRQIRRQLTIIKSRFPDGFRGRALDIGCSIAYGLSLLQEDGWSVLGLDPSDKCIETSKAKLNVEVEKGFFSAKLLSKRRPFDLVILSHVLEHLVGPDVVISGLSQILSDTGLAYIEVPNLMRPNGTKCYFGFEHVNFFTPASLTNLIEQSGFEVDSLSTYENGRDIHPFYPVIAMTIRKSTERREIKDDTAASLKVIRDYAGSAQRMVDKLNSRIQGAMANTAKGRLALWGAGIHTSQLLSETNLSAAGVHCIYDNDPKKAGNTLMGVEIRRFPVSVLDAKACIDAILISSEASENAIYQQLKPLEEQGIRIYRLYDDP